MRRFLQKSGGSAMAAAFAVATAACGGASAHSRDGGQIAALTVRAVAWNPSQATVGSVRAVAEVDDEVVVLSDTSATVLAAGAVVAVDQRVKNWVSAGTIPGADGATQWVVGVDAQGKVYRLRARTSFEDVSDRYGLSNAHVRGVASFGGPLVGFLLDGEIAIADGRNVARYGGVSLAGLTGGGGFGAAFAPDSVRLFDAATKTVKSFAVSGVTQVAMNAKGRLFAQTANAVYAQSPNGELALYYETSASSLHGLAVAGEHVWFADGTELGIIEDDKVAATTGAKIDPASKLTGSPSGDVWVVSGQGLARFARAEADVSMDARWTREIKPVFARVCAECHLPNGSAGIDLSNAESWQGKKSRIQQRVLITKTMPPDGHTIADADREAIRAWLDAPVK